MNIQIINERPRDEQQIHHVIELAFLRAAHTDHSEQFIVSALRHAQALTISMVAVVANRIIGHVAISPVSISDGSSGWYGLGPISVLPDFQTKGVGRKLMKESLAALEAMGAAGCVVLGDPDYYGRFGFRVVDGLILPGVPAEYFQALSFNNNYPQGDVTYHAAFSAQN